MDSRHCEERSDEAIQSAHDAGTGLLCFARNDDGGAHSAIWPKAPQKSATVETQPKKVSTL